MTQKDKENIAAMVSLVIKYNCPKCQEPKGSYRNCMAEMKVIKPSEKCLKEMWEDEES